MADEPTLDLPVTFSLIKSSEHGGYDLVVYAGDGKPAGGAIVEPQLYVLGQVPTPSAGLVALVNSLTAPLADNDRLDTIEEATGVISGLIDRINELESQYAAVMETTQQTRDAVFNLLARGGVGPAASAIPVSGPRSPASFAEQRRGEQQQVNLRDQGAKHVEPGLAGRLQRPLAEAADHARATGRFPGGAFGRGGTNTRAVLGPEESAEGEE